MKLLLTGYSGFLGQYLAKALIQKGFSLRVLLHRHTVLNSELHHSIEMEWGSLSDADAVRSALQGVDYVVHSAWSFSSPRADRPTCNEIASDRLFSESVLKGVKKFAFISSVAVYGMSEKKRTLIAESDKLAEGSDLEFIYPSEKINVEGSLRESDRKETEWAIFRPGPIFDDGKGPLKKCIQLGRSSLGIGIGTGRNQMAYIHAEDVADAVCRWLIDGMHGSTFNVVPSSCLRASDWIRVWGAKNNLGTRPVFIPGFVIRFLGFGVKMLKKILRKQSNADVKYALACAKRDMCYSNEALKDALGWKDDATSRYTKLI